jgi:hypothetical protein
MRILQIEVILTPKQCSKNKSGRKPKDKKCKDRHHNDEQQHNIESHQARLVWNQVFPQGMKILTSVKKEEDTIRNICKENDNSTNASNSHTKAAKRKQKTGRSSNIDITMMSSNESIKNCQRRLSLQNQTNHCRIPWESQPKNQSNTEAM